MNSHESCLSSVDDEIGRRIPRIVEHVQQGDIDGALVHVRFVNRMLEDATRSGAIDRDEFIGRAMHMRVALSQALGVLRFLALFMTEVADHAQCTGRTWERSGELAGGARKLAAC